MSYVKVWIHAVWGTKNREHVLSKDTQKNLFHHKKGTFMEEYEEFVRKFNFRSHG